MKIVLATKNEHKLIEFKRILEPLGYIVLSQTDIDINIDVDETGKTFEDNAFLKAKAINKECNLPTIADDSGLEVEALNNEPGIFSARYGGDKCKNDIERYELLLTNMKDITDENRQARYVCSICVVGLTEKPLYFTDYCYGKIGKEPKGKNGFGYDPIFMVGNKSMAEISPKEKDTISHRGNALKKMQIYFNDR